MTKRLLFEIQIIFAISIFVGAAARAEPTTLSLSDAIHLALKNSPVYDTAEKTETLNHLQYKNAIAKLLPSVDFTTTDGLQNNVPIASNSDLLFTTNPSAPWYSTLTLGVSETLYDNGVSLTNLTIAELNRDLARINSLKTRDGLALNVATEFYNFSLATVLLDVRKQQVTILGKQFELLSSQYQQGFKIRADYLRLKTQVQQSEIDEISAEDAIAQSAAKLRQILGINLKADQQPQFKPVPVLRAERFTELDDAKTPDLTQFYNTRLTEIQKEINDRSVDLAWRNYYPQVSLVTGASYSNQNYINAPAPFAEGHQLSWDALIAVQYNFWDWGTRRNNVQIAEGTRDVNDDTLNVSLEQTQADVEQMMAAFTRIRKNYRSIEQLLSMEEESNRLVEQQYREGKVTYLDLITSLNNLLDAKVQFYTVYFETLTDLAKHRYYEGEIYESLAKE